MTSTTPTEPEALADLRSALELCPHDLKAAGIEVDEDEWEIARVVCITCGASGPYVYLNEFDSVDEAKAAAAKLWNARPGMTNMALAQPDMFPAENAKAGEVVAIPKKHVFDGDRSALRLRFDTALAGMATTNGDGGWIVHTKGHAHDMECAIKVINALRAKTAHPPAAEPVGLREKWAAVRALLTGIISDVECAIELNEGIDALHYEGAVDARAGIELMDALIGIPDAAEKATPAQCTEYARLVEGDSDNPLRVSEANAVMDGYRDAAVLAALSPARTDDAAPVVKQPLMTEITQADADAANAWMRENVGDEGAPGSLCAAFAAHRVAALSPAPDRGEVKTTDGYPVNAFTLEDILAEMLAVATASITEDEDIMDEWPLDCRADVDRWLAVICGHLATIKPADATPAGEPVQMAAKIGKIKARADAIAHLTVPEDGNYKGNGQYHRHFRIARDAALAAFEEVAALQSGEGKE